MSLTPLVKKLRLQGAQRALVLSAPDGYLETLSELPEDLALEQKPEGKFDFAHLFVKNRTELDKFIDRVLKVIEYDAIFWISYPKGGSGVETDLNRDKLWKILQEKRIRPVTQVSIDNVWSAMRFRPLDAVGR